MIALRGRARWITEPAPLDHSVWLLVDSQTQTAQRTGSRAYLLAQGEAPPAGFALYLQRASIARPSPTEPPRSGFRRARLPLRGDIVSFGLDREQVRVLWRQKSKLNSVLLTERCDNYCLMCSQPPKTGNDDRLLEYAFDLIRLLPRNTNGIAFTGGEPTLYGERLIELLKLCRNLLPFAGIHILSNGRRFSDATFAASYAEVANPNMMVGIPIYGPEPAQHD